MDCFLAIDQGTQSSRAVIFDGRGKALAGHREPVSIRRLLGGRVEQDARALLDSVNRAVSVCLDSLAPAVRDAVRACGLAVQRSSVLACAPSGRAVGPVLSWQDTRAAGWLETLRDREAAIRRISGLPLSPHYGAGKLRWLKNRPDFREGFVLAPLASYLLRNLATDDAWRVDSCNAQRTQLFDNQALDWSETLLEWFEIPRSRLPDCCPVVSGYGELFETGIPITAVSGDQNAAVFGNGDLPDDAALINLGSGAFVLAEKRAGRSCGDLLDSIGATEQSRVRRLCEGTVNGAGSALAWASRRWRCADLSAALVEVDKPPVFINTVCGVGSPWWISGVEPFFVGDDNASDAARLTAVVESIAFLLVDNVTVLREKIGIRRLIVSGGLSNLEGLCQKLANLSGLPLEREDNTEATARGIAWLAAGQPPGWKTPPAERFEPRSDPGLRERYAIFRAELGSLGASS
ncbi:MAG TPA: hypothetical protein ENK26_04755 [Gammaproteobacteria bacterium]|nr:hypothetical protein [Gammaproteobacteria bacterium]